MTKHAFQYSILKHYLFFSLHMTDQISQLYKRRWLKKYIKINKMLCREVIYHMAYGDGSKRRRISYGQGSKWHIVINSMQNYKLSYYRISELYKQIPEKKPECLSYCTWSAEDRDADTSHHFLSSSVGNLPTQASLPLLYQHGGSQCGMLGTVHHLNQVQSLWKPCCAAKTKQLYHSSPFIYPAMWTNFVVLGFYTSIQSHIS